MFLQKLESHIWLLRLAQPFWVKPSAAAEFPSHVLSRLIVPMACWGRR